MIHVCFALCDKTGTYSRFTGTTMVSLFENTNSKVTVHLLHDNTLTDDNRDKLIQIAERYEQPLKFYNVEELCADRLAEIGKFFPSLDIDRYSFATFYRLFIPHLLPKEIEKAIYLDSDIIVYLDIAEFWQVKLAEHPLGAIPEIYQFKDKNAAIENRKHYAPILNPEDYFNAGVLLLNLKVLRNEEATIQAGMKFISEHVAAYPYQDQDILNYCFSTTYLKLPLKFNHFVLYLRRENEWSIQQNIYHYVGGRIHFNMDTNDSYTRLFMDYFIKIPWNDADIRTALSGEVFSSRKNYAVSVVIPMYNAEKHISECLDSLLIQTFQDFEVIVVDDCSIDNSVEVVKSYVPKFNGRLKLTKTETNSGTDCVPRNIGMLLARGEYLSFVDADDMLLGTALETLYKAASLYDTDIVYTSSIYNWNAPNDISLYKDSTTKKMPNVRTNLTIDDPSLNLSRLLLEPREGYREGNFHGAWTKFVRRDFILRNKIFFADLPLAGDFIGIIDMYCHARRFLRIDTSLYFYRTFSDTAMSRIFRPAREQCIHWFSSFVGFCKALRKLEEKNAVLAENPLYCLAASKKTLYWTLKQTTNARKELDSKELYKILHEEFTKISGDSLAVLLPFLFGFINNEKNFSDYYIEPINKFKNFITARIDIKLASTEGDFQIVSVSDSKASIQKPGWLQKGGIGYVIQSYTGQLSFTANATVDGQIQLWLRGIDVRDPQDSPKRIPYWIDYTNLTINDKPILETSTSAWHDKAYEYTMNAKADEEIKIHIEWQPHKADTIEIAPPKPEPKVETPPVKVESSIPDSFKPFFTARIDTKLMSKEGDFQIFSVSDDKATLKKPKWLQKGGVGYQLESYAGQLDFIAKTTANGQIQLRLRGLDVRDPENNAKRIPHWIDYTNLTINDKPIFDTLTPAWLNDSYTYTIDAKANEEIKIHIEWLPHRSDT